MSIAPLISATTTCPMMMPTPMDVYHNASTPLIDLKTLSPKVRSSIPAGKTQSYHGNIARSQVFHACSAIKNNRFMPITIGKSQVMLQPVALNDACKKAQSSGRLEATFYAVDNSMEFSLLVCKSGSSKCQIDQFGVKQAMTAPKKGGKSKRGSTCCCYESPCQAEAHPPCSHTYQDPDWRHCYYDNRVASQYKTCHNSNGDYCFSFNCDCPKPPSCFPSDAQVNLEDGSVKRMDQLAIGDRVLVVSNGKTFYDDIYMFGHKDADTIAEFVEIKTSFKTLHQSSDHYIIVKRGIVPARQVEFGDAVETEDGWQDIVSTRIIKAQGLYNPYTLSGKIVVNGVATSAHSSSALDSFFTFIGVEIPNGYQTIFAPIRLAYRVLGVAQMTKMHWIVDSVANLANNPVIQQQTVNTVYLSS
jgi:hypothetical protein